jgi:hypothetical protein
VAPPNSTNSKPEPFPWWIFLVIAAAVAIGLILYVDHRRRSSRQAARAQAASTALSAAPAEEASMGLEPEANPVPPMSSESFDPQYYPTPGEETVVPPVPEGTEVSGDALPSSPETSFVGETNVPVDVENPTSAPTAPEEVTPESTTSELPPPPESEPLTQCPQCGGPLDDQMGCSTCGVVWERGPESGWETQPLAATETPAGPETSASGDDTSAPPLPESPPPEDYLPASSPTPEPEAPTLFLGKICLVCGGSLYGDYCATCDMHWESGGSR